ncbi:MAG: glutamate--tRNA ligase [Rhizobiales bacterium]|nr:glutamate--tRNA ligase [Hyphomicrobiales bacterium]NRB13053.1 glutamate--tRNA ligase [Hyphomicrobiales bacterium]
MNPIVRFAPSPTGNIHIGNLRPALINWLFAKKHGGTFILRFDDTDAKRSKQEFMDNIREDLTWLGLTWDQEENQSKRFDRYEAVAQQLREMDLLYACYETAEELDFKRKRQMSRGMPPVYDRAALALSDDEIKAFEADGRTPHWRFKLQQKIVVWPDLVRGEQHIDTGSLSDPVLIRADGTWLYTLASIIDDIDMGVTHIIRGEDHVANTGVQLEIFGALGATAPTFGHHNLLVGKDGEGLSKRLGSLSIRELRAMQYEPLSVLSLSATIGSSNPVKPYLDIADILADFDISKLSRAAARFDSDELISINAKLLHATEFNTVASRLADLGLKSHNAQAIWDATKTNIETFKDIKIWADIVDGKAKPIIADDDKDFIATALELLPTGDYDDTSWGIWTKAIKQTTGRKGKTLFMPLRLALTGLDHGAELKTLLPLIGEANARNYLNA